MPTLSPTTRSPEPTPATTSQAQRPLARIIGAVTDHINRRGIVPIVPPIGLRPRTQLMFLPNDQAIQISRLAGFDLSMQTKYPEAYALAVQIDQFGQQKVAFLRMTMEQYKSHKEPKLLKEFSKLSNLMTKATGQELYTPGIHTDRPESVAIKIEAIAIEIGNLAKEYHQHRLDHPLQSQVDLLLSAPRVAGGLTKDAFKLVNYLVKLKYPDDPIARGMGPRVDALAATIGNAYVEMIQRVNAGYDPHSPSSRVGDIAWQMVPIGRAAATSRVATRSGAAASRGVRAVEGVATRRIVALERVNGSAYRSGFIPDETIIKLAEKEVRIIKPLKLPPIERGSELTWLSESASKIRQLKEIKGINRFDRFLKSTFKDQSLSENQIRRLLNYSGFKTYQRPRGLPHSCAVEFSDKNGGMIYRLFGTTEKQNILVRVSPGTRKENIVTATINGSAKNGRWRQQTPYVVQRRGKEYLTTEGKWIEEADPALTHIPLEIYEFKGW